MQTVPLAALTAHCPRAVAHMHLCAASASLIAQTYSSQVLRQFPRVKDYRVEGETVPA